MLHWSEDELRAMQEADAEIDAQGDLFPGVNRTIKRLCEGSKNQPYDPERARRYYLENRSKIRAYQRDYYKKNKDRLLAEKRIRYATDSTYRDSIQRNKEQWMQNNPDKVQKYYQDSHERRIAYQKEYRKRKKGEKENNAE